ncbi:hypothetical protein Q4601_18310 [Shewanella sp. 1_MG-2023]|uniref:hypothetical protein n=1 Tax=unclassified Shewanella TaxID=196818 RepID=UPI0026E46F48|nr:MULTISPECIES: hypothetical protein [unclassified Shewanella]MDO6613106.1 hypothetical protein [Shewanella sp. 7_MG-2023]MDO6772975.1 hypothetical protein [Shewanella sp. 2_MG-2023]MDO6796250.1 hypothetical protein [Shewanella sp. 1_MG-2023]
MSAIHSNNVIVHVKKLAKKLKKAKPTLKHNQCLDECAQSLGYTNYYQLLTQHPLHSSQDSVATTSILEQFSVKIKEVLDFSLSKHKEDFSTLQTDTLQSKESIIAEYWQLLLEPIDKQTDLNKVEQLTRWGIDKEIIKEIGHYAEKEEDGEIKRLGYLLVAIGHYYRSLMDNCSRQIAEHINFESYFCHWLHSMHPNVQGNDVNSKALKELKQRYPIKDNLEMHNHATSWAPQWWLKDMGRIQA